MASGPIILWQIGGEAMETVRDFILGGSKITADGDCGHEIKRHLLLRRKAMINLDSILKTRDIILLTKVHLVKVTVFPTVMYRCESWTIKKAVCVCAHAQSCQTLCSPTDYSPPGSSDHGIPQARILECVAKQGSALKNWCFQIAVLGKTPESTLDCREIKPVNPKRNQSWIFIGRTVAKAPILWPPNVKSQLTGKDPNAGKNRRQREKGTEEDEIVSITNSMDMNWTHSER